MEDDETSRKRKIAVVGAAHAAVANAITATYLERDLNTSSSYSQNGLNDVENTDTGEKSVSVEGEDLKENLSAESTKVLHSRRHGKRSRTIDEVKHMLEETVTCLHELRETIDPLAFARQLREAVMGIQGFTHKYLNSAFKLLMRQELEAKIFLITDEEGRRDALTELRPQIGNI